jgi:hypothetical protein
MSFLREIMKYPFDESESNIIPESSGSCQIVQLPKVTTEKLFEKEYKFDCFLGEGS